jgi:hypothetical protein
MCPVKLLILEINSIVALADCGQILSAISASMPTATEWLNN